MSAAGRTQFRRRKSARLCPGAGTPPGRAARPRREPLPKDVRPEPVPRTVAAARRIAARGRQRLQRERSMKRR
jgi:hypothetical protein